MARQEDGRNLIHHLLQGEMRARLRMPRLDQRLEDVLVRRGLSGMEGVEPFRHDRREHAANGVGGPFRPAFEPAVWEAV